MAQGLMGFQPQATQAAQPVETPTAATQVAGQQLSTLSNRLKGFSDAMIQRHADVVADKAADKALNDLARTGTFDKEEVYTIYGKAYNKVATATYAAQTELVLDAKASELAITYQDNPVGYADNMEEFTKGLLSKAPTPELRTTVGIYGGNLKNRGFGAISTKMDREYQDGQREVFDTHIRQQISKIINAEDTGEREKALLLFNNSKNYLDTMRNEGLLTDSQYFKYQKVFAFEAEKGTKINELSTLLNEGKEEEAIAFLSEEVGKEREDMTPTQNSEYKKALGSIYTKFQSQKKAESKGLSSEANAKLSQYSDLLDSGASLNGEQIEEIESYTPHASFANQEKLRIAKETSDFIAPFRDAPLSDLEDMYNERKHELVSEDVDIVDKEIVDHLGKLLADKKAMSKSDPVGLSVQEGNTPALEMGREAGITGLLEGLNVMRKNTFIIQEKYGETKKQLLTAVDAKSWADHVNSPDVSIDEKIELISEVSKKYPDISSQVFNQIAGKNAPTFGFAAYTMSAGSNEAARLAFKGKGVDVPMPTGFKNKVKAYIGDAFSHFPKEYNTAYQGVIDYSKGKSIEGEEISEMDKDIGEYFGESIGYIVDYNGQNTILPQGVTEDDFNSWLDGVQIEGNEELAKLIQDMPDTFDGDYQLITVGDGKYKVREYNKGNPIYHKNKDGSDFILKYPKGK